MVCLDAARQLNMVKNKKQTKKKTQNNRPWFNADCKRDRKAFLTAQRKHKENKLNHTRENDRNNAAKEYKKTIRRSARNYQNNLALTIRSLRSKNPKDYWDYLIEKKDSVKSNKSPSCEKFAEMFKSLGENSSNEENSNLKKTNFFNYIDLQMYLRDPSKLDETITIEEVKNEIHDLKTNKAHGLDLTINEFFKNATDGLITVFTKIFNLVLETGIIPSAWSLGVIRPIYKNKGNIDDPNNYRGISILSCFGKLFSRIISKRLGIYLEQFNILGPEQTGFRKGYSTLDNIFALYGIIDLLLAKHKRLYCGFLDYEKAFDKVERALLWHKLLEENISGKIINVIKNMYANAKSCVMIENNVSELFNVDIGVRQGDNLSPVLFSLFLNDMNDFLNSTMKGLKTITDEAKNCDMSDKDIGIFIKLFVLLYADDTIIFAENAQDLQRGLSKIKEYCDKWKLKLNTNKCKVVIFSRGVVRNYPDFSIGEDIIEVVRDFTYLGIKLNYNNKFNVAQKDLYDRASRAMFALIKKSKILNLPVDVMIDLFDKTIMPVLLYGSEIWGFQCVDLIEKLQLKFYKSILKLRASTPTQMVLGETGCFPITINTKSRSLMYWYNLVSTDNCNKLSSIVYRLLYKMHIDGTHECLYLKFIKSTLIEIGLPYVWEIQSTNNLNRHWFKNYIKTTLQNQFVQNWQSTLDNNSIYTTYRMIKSNFTQSPYMSRLVSNCIIPITRFITTNNKLPINVLRFENIERRERFCTKCNSIDIGDEFHCLFICPYFSQKRKELLPNKFTKKPNAIQFFNLINNENKNTLLKLKHFICLINKTFT